MFAVGEVVKIRFRDQGCMPLTGGSARSTAVLHTIAQLSARSPVQVHCVRPIKLGSALNVSEHSHIKDSRVVLHIAAL